MARSGDVPAALVLTKADLAAGPDGGDPAAGGDPDDVAARLRRRLGLADAVAVSATAGDGLGVLQTLLAPGSTAVLLGPSGAGKSTLVNALLGEQRQATGEVRASDGRGRHTTVTRELIAMPNGAFLIDTPGLREAGVWDGADFEDVDALAAGCRFADCAHESDPGCAVRTSLDPARLAAWRKLRREQAWVDDRRAASRARERLGRERTRELRRRGNL
jgi:ribosome biogenesis GTPase